LKQHCQAGNLGWRTKSGALRWLLDISKRPLLHPGSAKLHRFLVAASRAQPPAIFWGIHAECRQAAIQIVADQVDISK